jgi:hypothetical protein
LDAIRDDLSAALFAAVGLGFVFAVMQSAFDENLAALLEILVAR